MVILPSGKIVLQLQHNMNMKNQVMTYQTKEYRPKVRQYDLQDANRQKYAFGQKKQYIGWSGLAE